MLEVWLPLLGTIALGAIWYHVLRLREHAVAHAQRLCERHGLQLLDDSVALRRLHLRRRRGTLQVLREYRFDTSRGGNDRETASLTLASEWVVHSSLPTREPAAGVQPAAPIRATLPQAGFGHADDNVIPIDRARAHGSCDRS